MCPAITLTGRELISSSAPCANLSSSQAREYRRGERPWRWLIRGWTAKRERIPGTVAGVRTDQPLAALTFDDGPHPVYTPQLLEILRRHKAQGTFFMIGEAAQKHPEVVALVAQSGHAIGNHTWDHPYLPGTRGKERRRQIRACQRTLAPYGKERLFRPPYGAQSWASYIDARWLGYKVIGWNVEPKDWTAQSPSEMAERLAREIRPGGIVLLHDAIYRSNQPTPQYNREPMLAGLELFLGRFGQRYRFVTVPELLRSGRAE